MDSLIFSDNGRIIDNFKITSIESIDDFGFAIVDASLLNRTNMPYETSFNDMLSKFIERFERITGTSSTVRTLTWIVVPQVPDYFFLLKGNLMLLRFVCW